MLSSTSENLLLKRNDQIFHLGMHYTTIIDNNYIYHLGNVNCLCIFKILQIIYSDKNDYKSLLQNAYGEIVWDFLQKKDYKEFTFEKLQSALWAFFALLLISSLLGLYALFFSLNFIQ